MGVKKVEPKILSLFSGCGGLDYGFHKAGYKTVWANDINEWAAQTFTENFGKNIITQKNIEEIFPNNDPAIPDCDLIIGGFPCQDFSVVWKQPGLEGDRGNLYEHYLRFINIKKPKAFVAENVKGLLTANKGKAIEKILKGFSEAGDGYLVKIQLYNFADYGVPQFRERIIIVGVQLDTGFNFVHPAPTHGEGRANKHKTAGEALKGVEKVKDFKTDEIKITEKTKKLLARIPEGGNFKDIPADDPEYVKGKYMIFRTSYDEFGHCLTCWHDFDPEELWEQNIEVCPDCGEHLYTDDNPGHYIPEDTDFMNKKRNEYHLRHQAELKYGKKVVYVQ
jgi:DNA (cytosine-5)-methyltransferase 1